MPRWRAYLLLSVLLALAFGGLLLLVGNCYAVWSPGQATRYYFFRRNVPAPLGAVLWNAIGPLLLITPAGSGWAAYRCARARAAGRSAHLCRRCGYNLTGNVSGVCPECGTARRAAAGTG